MLGAYSNQPAAVIFFAGVLTVTGLVLLMLWLYVTHDRRLATPDLSERLVRHHTLQAILAPAVFTLSI